jgi:hypothetical protein
MTTFYCLRFETLPTWRARSPYLYPPGTGWSCYTPRHWVPVSSSRTTRRACFAFALFLFRNLRQSVRLLGRVISPSQGRYLTQTQNKDKRPCLEWDSNPRSLYSSERRQLAGLGWSYSTPPPYGIATIVGLRAKTSTQDLPCTEHECYALDRVVEYFLFPPVALQPFLGPWPHISVSKSILHRR